jgi:hypothetical protein
MAYNPQNPNGQAFMTGSTPVVVASDQTTIKTSLEETSTGGANIHHYVSLSGTNQQVITTSPARITGWYIYNDSINIRRISFYDSTTVQSIGNTGAPFKFSVVVPSESGANCSFPGGISFGTGITYNIGTVVNDSNSTSPTSDYELSINIFYKD